MSINLHLLRLYTAVVEHGGVVAASRALNVSQPAVSRAVRELERQLGVPLLERGTRGVRPTADGAEIYAHARGVFSAERAVEEAVHGLKGIERGALHIGASTTIATYVIPTLIAEFANAHPGIDLRLSAVHTRTLVDMLLRYELDIAVAEAPVDNPRIRVTPWRWDEMVVIAAPGHRLVGARSKDGVDVAELSNEVFILREPESGTRKIVESALHRAGVRTQRIMAVDGTEVIKQLVAEGLGLGVVSRFAVTDQLAIGRLVVLEVRGLVVRRPFNRLLLVGRRPSSAAREFRRLLATWSDASVAKRDRE
jgi:DNA-binding transcriptional LysR family regulator